MGNSDRFVYKRMARRVLVAITAFVTICSTDSAPVGVGSFIKLDMAVASGAPAIEITAPKIVFEYHLHVRHAKMLIESAIGGTLPGRYQTSLFFLENGTKLSLHGVRLENGVARGCAGGFFECRTDGGAVFVRAGSEVRLTDRRFETGATALLRTGVRSEISDHDRSKLGAFWKCGTNESLGKLARLTHDEKRRKDALRAVPGSELHRSCARLVSVS